MVLEGNKVSESQDAYLIDVKKQQANAKDGKVRKLPLFVGEKEGKTFYVAPLEEKGCGMQSGDMFLWMKIW